MNFNSKILVLVLLAASLGPAACGGSAPDVESDTANQQDDWIRGQEEWASSLTVTATTTTQSPETTTPSSEKNIYTWGETMHSTIFDATATKAPASGAVIVTITVQNNSPQVIEGYIWSESATIDGKRAESTSAVLPLEESLGLAPDILPGKTGTWKKAYKVPVGAGEVTYSLEYGLDGASYWTGPLG